MTRIEEIEKSVQWARDVFARDETHYAKADAEDMIIPLPMNHRDLRNILSHIGHLTANVERLNKKQKWDDIESTRLSCTLMGSQKEIEKLTAQLTAKDAEIERLREACEKVVEQYNVIEFDVDMSNWIEAVVLYDKAMLALKLALAATADGEGG